MHKSIGILNGLDSFNITHCKAAFYFKTLGSNAQHGPQARDSTFPVNSSQSNRIILSVVISIRDKEAQNFFNEIMEKGWFSDWYYLLTLDISPCHMAVGVCP